MNFDELKSKCDVCTNCRLCETRTRVVFGVGVKDAEVMFIGEGPGKSEDEVGEPFVGRSGQLLDKFLEEINLSRHKNIFISNIVKCCPPENRDPSKNERMACMPYLQSQISIIQPKIVVCLGRVAAQTIINTNYSVTKEHGLWTLKNGVYYTATLHPAAILRNMNNKSAAKADFAELRNKITAVCTHTY